MSKHKVLVLNGPNLNLLAPASPISTAPKRWPTSSSAAAPRPSRSGSISSSVSRNAEHELIDWLHAARHDTHGIVINPAAYTHTSVALADALSAIAKPVIEVHISNVHRARHSVTIRTWRRSPKP